MAEAKIELTCAAEEQTDDMETGSRLDEQVEDNRSPAQDDRLIHVLEMVGNEMRTLSSTISEMYVHQKEMFHDLSRSIGAIDRSISRDGYREPTDKSLKVGDLADGPSQSTFQPVLQTIHQWESDHSGRGTSSRQGPMSGTKDSFLLGNRPFPTSSTPFSGYKEHVLLDTPTINQMEGTLRQPSMTNSRLDSGQIFTGYQPRKTDIPRQKLPTFDGNGDWEGFILPFERAALRNAWSQEEKLDRFIECLRGQASKYLSAMPRQLLEDFEGLKKEMENRFDRKDPPTTARKKLADLRQKSESNEEFAEEARRLVTRAFPSVSIEMQDELAAEAFLKGHKNSKIAYEALNQQPTTVAGALDLVAQMEHNYKATIGRDTEVNRSKSRRVSWQDMQEEEPSNDMDLNICAVKTGSTLQDEIRELRKLLEMNLKPQQKQPSKGYPGSGQDAKMQTPQDHRGRGRSLSPSTSTSMQNKMSAGCFTCGEKSHFQRDCPRRRSRSPSPRPNRNQEMPAERPLYKIGKLPEGRSIIVQVQINGVPTEAIVDTGADVTVLSQTFADNVGLEYSYGNSVNLLNAQTGKEMEATMDVKVTLQIGPTTIDWPVCIAPIRDNILIGMDLLQDLDGVILAKQGDLLLQGTLVPGWYRQKSPHHVARVTVAGKTTLLPRSETVITGQLDKPRECRVGVLDPASLKSGAHAGSVLVQMKEKIPIRMLNPTSKPIVLNTGIHLGKLVEVHDPDNEEQSKREKIEVACSGSEVKTLPEHLKEMVSEASENLTANQKKELEDLITDFQDVFAEDDEDLGCFTEIKHTIPTGSAQPVRQPPRRTPLGFQGEEKEHLDGLLKNGTVVPSTSDWASPVVLVRKKDGGVRWCIDYRKLNAITTKDSYPLPNIEECLDTLSGATMFSTLDLQSGYHQIEVSPEDRKKTAFITRYGLFEYTRMPFGLCGAPGTFERAMELVLKGLQWEMVLIYLDDVIIGSRGFEEHLQHLTEVFERFRTFHLKLKPKKCHLFQKRVLFLGHFVSQDGIETNAEVTKVVKDWPEPSNTKQVQTFLGLTNYYRRYIQSYADIAEPLYKLLPKGVEFVWETMQQQAFDRLKSCLTTSPVLAFPLPEETFTLDTDASNTSIGAVLSQSQAGQERVIAYASKRLSPAQAKYCVTRRELLAVVTFTAKFQHYLLGRQFVLRTDHGSLVWLLRFKSPQGQLSRWLEQLSQFDMVIQHRQGKSHSNADALSRYPAEEDCNCYEAGADPNLLPCGGCRHCVSLHNQWERFETDVDDIVPIAVRRLETEPNKEGENEEVRYWLDGYSLKDLAEEQSSDPVLKVVKRWTQEGPPEKRSELFREAPALRHFWLNIDQIEEREGVLFYRWAAHESERSLLMVPGKLKKEVLELCHSSLLAGHPGIHRTMARLRQQFYWHNMREDVTDFVSCCPQCSLSKKESRPARAGMQDYHAGSRLDRIQLDILGPFPRSKRGNKYILVLVDQFSKWTEAYPLADQTAETVAEVFVKEFCTRFGIPLEVHTDQGRNFDSALMHQLGKVLGWARTRTTPYHPSSNGLVERFNRTLLSMMRCFVSKSQDNWDEFLPFLTGAYRSTPHTSTGLTPNRLMLGSEVRLPQDLIFGLPAASHKQMDHSEYIENLRESLQKSHEHAREFLKKSSISQKQSHDLRRNERSFKPGDLVYIMDTTRTVGKSPKLQAQWRGPYIVVKKVSTVLYDVADRKGNKVLHHDRLKPCCMESVPAWVNRYRRELSNTVYSTDCNEIQDGPDVDDPRTQSPGSSTSRQQSHETHGVDDPRTQSPGSSIAPQESREKKHSVNDPRTQSPGSFTSSQESPETHSVDDPRTQSPGSSTATLESRKTRGVDDLRTQSPGSSTTVQKGPDGIIGIDETPTPSTDVTKQNERKTSRSGRPIHRPKKYSD